MRKWGFLKDDEGATAIEYALVVACIAMVVIGGVTRVGTEVSEQFDDIAEQIGGSGGSDTTLPAKPPFLRPPPTIGPVKPGWGIRPDFPRYEKGYTPLPKRPRFSGGLVRLH